MKNKIDYSEYTLDQLLDVKQHIDPEEAPENYQNLMTELKKRDTEIQHRESLIVEKRKNKAEKRKKGLIFFIKVLSWLQMVGGLLLIGLFLWLLIKHLSDIKSLLLLPTLIIPMFSIAAGYLLLKAKKIGIYLSIANQFLQLFHIQIPGFVYQYYLIYGVYLYMGDMKVGINTEFGANFVIKIGTKISTPYFALNLFSILSIILLERYISLLKESSDPFSSLSETEDSLSSPNQHY